jgi:hypothetical protein
MLLIGQFLLVACLDIINMKTLPFNGSCFKISVNSSFNSSNWILACRFEFASLVKFDWVSYYEYQKNTQQMRETMI